MNNNEKFQGPEGGDVRNGKIADYELSEGGGKWKIPFAIGKGIRAALAGFFINAAGCAPTLSELREEKEAELAEAEEEATRTRDIKFAKREEVGDIYIEISNQLTAEAERLVEEAESVQKEANILNERGNEFKGLRSDRRYASGVSDSNESGRDADRRESAESAPKKFVLIKIDSFTRTGIRRLSDWPSDNWRLFVDAEKKQIKFSINGKLIKTYGKPKNFAPGICIKIFEDGNSKLVEPCPSQGE